MLGSVSSLYAQNKLTFAVQALQNGDLKKAQELIDAAKEDTLFSKDARTWYYRGFIYKELYKQDEKDSKTSAFRNTSVESFKQAFNLNKEGEIFESTKKNLIYLASTIFNDAATSFNPDEYQLAIKNYESYKEIMKFVDPNIDFTDRDIQFKLALATTYTQMAEAETTRSDEKMEKVMNLYKEVLAVDSNNVSANYNMGILYYNEGVDIVNNMDYSADLADLNRIQEEIYILLRKSLPYMKKAYDLNPNRKETLIGLQGIYYSLNDTDKSESFKKKLEQIKAQKEKEE